MSRFISSLLCAALVAGCGVGAVEDEGALFEASQDELATERTAKASGLTIWIERDIVPVERDGGTAWMVRGRASKDLNRVFPFICDDQLGGALLTDPRHFEITFDWRDFEVALYHTLYIAFTTVEGRDYYATYTVAPRVTNFSGPTNIWVKDSLVARGNEWVGEFTTSKVPSTVSVYNDIDTDPVVTPVSATRWNYAWPNVTQMLSMPMGGAPLFFRAEFPNGTVATKRAQVVLSVPKVTLSTQAPY